MSLMSAEPEKFEDGTVNPCCDRMPTRNISRLSLVVASEKKNLRLLESVLIKLSNTLKALSSDALSTIIFADSKICIYHRQKKGKIIRRIIE